MMQPMYDVMPTISEDSVDNSRHTMDSDQRGEQANIEEVRRTFPTFHLGIRCLFGKLSGCGGSRNPLIDRVGVR